MFVSPLGGALSGYINHLHCSSGNFASGYGSVVKHSTADPGIASSTPLTPTKITKKEIHVCTGSSQEKYSRISVLNTEHVKEPGLSCVVGAPVSCTMGHK